jgi:transcriptional regulator GlxA family with amidase domain
MIARLLLSVLLLSAPAAPPSPGAATFKPPKDRKIVVAVVLTEGATVIDFAGPWEVFEDVHVPERGQTMDEKMPFELFTVGSSREPIHTSGGMTVVPQFTFATAPVPDVIVVGAQKGAPELSPWLRRMRGKSRVIMSVCTGAFRLAEAGLLDGKRATTHHDFYESFAVRNPKVTVVRSKRYVQADEVVFTGGGLSSGIDLALHVVELYFGREAAERTARYMEYQGTGWKE